MRRFGLPAKLVLLALSASAVAETHFCIGGNLDQLNATQVSECRAKMADMRNAVKQHGAPAGWHFVVVCDEDGWKEYTNFAGQEATNLVQAAYSTDAEMHWTFVRGSRMDAKAPGQAEVVLAAAMKNVPAQRVAPLPLASPKRSLASTEQQVAEINEPGIDERSGQ